MANDNKPSISDVEQLANTLCSEYRNSKFFAWYCGAIYEFGITAIEDLMKRVGDARQPGMLFTKIVNDWRKDKSNRIKKIDFMGKKTSNPEIIYLPTPDADEKGMVDIFDYIFELLLTEENTH